MIEGRVEYYGREDREYPQRLKSLARMPVGLYVKGRLPQEDRPTVAIAGARMCSAYGRQQAFTYAKTLAEYGVQVISGLAYGIDASAHEGAMAGGGKIRFTEACLSKAGVWSQNFRWAPRRSPGIFR